MSTDPSLESYYSQLTRHVCEKLVELSVLPSYVSQADSLQFNDNVVEQVVCSSHGDYPSHLLPMVEIFDFSSRNSGQDERYQPFVFYPPGNVFRALHLSCTQLLEEALRRSRHCACKLEAPFCLFEPAQNCLRLSLRFRYGSQIKEDLCRRHMEATRSQAVPEQDDDAVRLTSLLRKTTFEAYDVSFLITDHHLFCAIGGETPPAAVLTTTNVLEIDCFAQFGHLVNLQDPSMKARGANRIAGRILQFVRDVERNIQLALNALTISTSASALSLLHAVQPRRPGLD